MTQALKHRFDKVRRLLYHIVERWGSPNGELNRKDKFHIIFDARSIQLTEITDHDLDRNPDLLKGYKAVLINGHSECWSARAYDGLDNYLKAGGAAVVMSGNTMFWRVSFDESGEVMECRKFGKAIGGRNLAKVGELYHSHDFKRGSLMRFADTRHGNWSGWNASDGAEQTSPTTKPTYRIISCSTSLTRLS